MPETALTNGKKCSQTAPKSVRSVQDYYPFGMHMPGRSYVSGDGHRYGFQGQEKDNEVKGDGNSVNFKYRMEDPRLGRFFAIDPLFANYPYYSPYHFASNSPVMAIDLEGLQTSVQINIPEAQILISRDLNGMFYITARDFAALNRANLAAFTQQKYQTKGVSRMYGMEANCIDCFGNENSQTAMGMSVWVDFPQPKISNAQMTDWDLGVNNSLGVGSTRYTRTDSDMITPIPVSNYNSNDVRVMSQSAADDATNMVSALLNSAALNAVEIQSIQVSINPAGGGGLYNSVLTAIQTSMPNTPIQISFDNGLPSTRPTGMKINYSSDVSLSSVFIED